MRQKLLCQQAGQTGGESVRVEEIWEGDNKPQSDEEEVDQADKQRKGGDVDRRSPENNKKGSGGPTPSVCTQIKKSIMGKDFTL